MSGRDFPLYHQLATVEEQSFLELWELQNKKLNVYSKKSGFNGERKVNAKKAPKLKAARYLQHSERGILPLVISRDVVTEN